MSQIMADLKEVIKSGAITVFTGLIPTAEHSQDVSLLLFWRHSTNELDRIAYRFIRGIGSNSILYYFHLYLQEEHQQFGFLLKKKAQEVIFKASQQNSFKLYFRRRTGTESAGP